MAGEKKMREELSQRKNRKRDITNNGRFKEWVEHQRPELAPTHKNDV